jgi:ABC-2 type transport system permease protein
MNHARNRNKTGTKPGTVGPFFMTSAPTETPPTSSQPSALGADHSSFRAWCYLVRLSMQRQARARQMVWMAVGLLLFSMALVAIFTARGNWGMNHWRYPRRIGSRYDDLAVQTEALANVVVSPAGALFGSGVEHAVLGAYRAAVEESGFYVFSAWFVFWVFLSFLLPLWSLSFATEAFGAEREGSSLVWLLTRPMSRPAIYLAKFVALLPWSLGLNIGGLALICLVAGKPGLTAFRLYWPAVLCATLAFSALFHLMGACFRRAAVIAIVYSFFLESLLGNMPGYMKRISLGFYARCMMFDAAQGHGMQPEKPSIFLPVDGFTAMATLLGATVVLLLVGMALFSRLQYQDQV